MYVVKGADFVVPAGAGNYAPESLTFQANRGQAINRLSALTNGAVAGAVLEVWALKDGGNIDTAADYRYVAAITT